MTEGLAIEIAAQKMREMGAGCNYLLRFRHLIVERREERVLPSHNEVWILLSPVPANLRVSSKSGAYDLSVVQGEMQYVHSGSITLTSFEIKNPIQVKFLQVIPTLQKA